MLTHQQIMKLKENSKVGWILQVDLEYPEELKDSHNSYPLKSEKKRRSGSSRCRDSKKE